MNRKQLVEIIDQACWDARRYGHDDNGLEPAVDLDGNPTGEIEPAYHPSAVEAANKILEIFP